MLVVAGRAMTAEQFGAVALLLALVVAAQGLCGALFNEVSLLKPEGRPGAKSNQDSEMIDDPVAASAYSGVVLAVPIASWGLIASDNTIGSGAYALAVALPTLLLQDSLRFRLLAAFEPGKALLFDTVFLVLWLVPGLVVRPQTPAALILLVGAAGLLGSGLGLILSGKPFGYKTRPWRYVRANRGLSGPLFGEYATINLLSQLSLVAITAFLGLSATAGLRAAQSIFGPLNTLQNAIRVAVTPQFVRLANTGASPRRAVNILQFAVVGVTVMWVAGAVLLPRDVGTQLFGESWALAVPLLIAVGLQRLAGAFQVAPLVGLRAIGRTPSASLVRSLGAILNASAVIAAAIWFSISEVAWAAAWAGLIVTIALTAVWFRASRHRQEMHGGVN